MSDQLMEGAQIDQELFKRARDFTVPIGKIAKGKTIDTVAATDEGLRWLVFVWNKKIAREPFHTHLKNYLFDKSIHKEVEDLGLELESE